MNAIIGFKLQVTSTPGFHSLYDRCYQAMWLFSGAPDDPEDETVKEKYGAYALYSTVKSLRYAIRTEDEKAQQDVAHRMLQIPKPWTMRRWSKSNHANRKPPVRILKENAHLIDLEWTEDEQAKLKALVERYTSLGASSARCNSVRKPHTNLPDTPVALTTAPEYFQMLPAPLELWKVLSDSA